MILRISCITLLMYGVQRQYLTHQSYMMSYCTNSKFWWAVSTFQSESSWNPIGIQLSIGFLLDSDWKMEICWNPIGKWKPCIFQFQIFFSIVAGTLFYETRDLFQLESGNPLESNYKLEIRWNPIANWNPIGILLELGLESTFPIGNWIRFALKYWPIRNR